MVMHRHSEAHTYTAYTQTHAQHTGSPLPQDYAKYQPAHREGVDFMRTVVLYYVDHAQEHDNSREKLPVNLSPV